jgi:hypothetical protein
VKEIPVLKQLILVVALLFSVARADALEYTDVYYNPAEPGWGLFLVQSDTTQFVALFIYGTDNKPTWYTAVLAQDAAGNYNGQLYATTGTYFGSPWNPAQSTEATVGTIAFNPTNIYRGTVTYALAGGPTVTKTVQRQNLTPYVLPGNYSGSASGTQLGCSDPSMSDPKFRGRYNLAVTQTGDTAAAMTITFADDPQNNGVVCTIQGALTHFGRLYRMATAQLTCKEPGATTGETTTVAIESLHPTGQGIEFRLSGPTGGGCVSSLHFAAVLNN